MTRRTAVALLVLPALAVVALAARSYRPFGGESSGERASSSTFIDGTFTVVLVLGVAVTALLIWLRVLVRRTSSRREDRSPLSALVVFLIVVVTMVGFRQMLPPPGGGGEPSDAAFGGELTPPPPAAEPVAQEPRGARVIWPLAVGLGGVLAAAVVVAVLLARRRDRDGPLTQQQVDELTRALDEAIEDLRRDPDPRRAVVAAYARMEQALAVHGFPRRPSEAPFEYLRRVAHEVEADRPVEALTELFEVAKFSEHAVDESMRQKAIDALSAVRREVRAGA